MPRTIIGQTVYGTALLFNGTTQYAKTAANPSTATDNFTIAAWVKPTALNTQLKFFSNGDTGASGTGYSLRMNSSNILGIDYEYVAAIDSAVTAVAGTWYHLAAVRTAGTTQLYVNGVASGSTSASTPYSPIFWASVGCESDDSGNPSLYSACTIDDARIYDRALSAAEITVLYNYGININNPNVSSSGLKLWWKMDEGSGTSLTDYSGNSQTGTVFNAPTWTTGKVMVSNVGARVASSARTTSLARTLHT